MHSYAICQAIDQDNSAMSGRRQYRLRSANLAVVAEGIEMGNGPNKFSRA
jgi:hypothetical protein